ncbi:hypothetical protein [Haliangium sp.]|uniref:hypothetical protein n=1 Tax=Haliangium sp. TaxID=2663208 RepID=UPI003D106793
MQIRTPLVSPSLWLCALVCCLACACKSDKAQPQATTEPASTEAQPVATPAAPAQAKPAPMTQKQREERRQKAEAAVRAKVAAWVEAQNKGDAAGYHAMYQPDHFKGVKRTHDGKVRRYDAAGWAKDRGRMFERGPIEVAADELTVTTWLDPDADLETGVSVARFIQRWRSSKYADHGVKVLHFWRDREGELAIIYEDLLNSEPGWDRTPSPDVETLALQAPESREQAMAIWTKLAPTGENYHDVVATIPSEAAGAMAAALIEDGNFQCEDKVSYDECGNEYEEWNPLPGDAGLDNPCLRRRLLLWGLGELSPAQLDALAAELAKLVQLSEPEAEVPTAVIEAVAAASEATRIKVLNAAGDELAATGLDGLSDDALVALYRDTHLDEAVKELSQDKRQEVLFELLADGELTPDTRMGLLTELPDEVAAEGKKVLASIAQTAESCELAMDAADRLAEMGDAQYLPARPDGQSPYAHARALCLLVYDPDPVRQLERWEQFLPAKGKITVRHEVDDDFTPDEEEEPERVERISRDDIAQAGPDEALGGDGGSCSGSNAEGSSTCEVETEEGHYDVTFTKAKDGTLRITDLHTYVHYYCPC